MNFFEHQALAKKRTKRLLIYFVLAVFAIILSLHVVVCTFWYFLEPQVENAVNRYSTSRQQAAMHNPPRRDPFRVSEVYFRPAFFAWVACISTAVILLLSWARMLQLGSGGEVVAEMLGGRRIDPWTKDIDERRLLNVVEEMALASGIPVPPVYVMDQEKSINAFAAGLTIENAVVGISRGALTHLSRDELQGVVGHEFSHILSGDMRLNIRLMGIIYGIVFIAQLGVMSFYLARILALSGGGSSRDNKGGAVPIALLALGSGISLWLIGSLGQLFASMIQSAVSRQREYLADASAVQFTRNPSGIADALKKIGGFQPGSSIERPQAKEASHFFFSSIAKFGDALATHPPLPERIQRIEPGWDGKYPDTEHYIAAAAESKGGRSGKKGKKQSVADVLTNPTGVLTEPTNAISQLGQPTLEKLLVAGTLLNNTPKSAREAVRDPYAARAIVYAMLLSDKDDVCKKQLAVLAKQAEKPVYQETGKLLSELQSLDKGARLPLVELAIPALKRMTQSQFDNFRAIVNYLIEADGRVDLSEYAIRAMLLRTLDVYFSKAKHRPSNLYALKVVHKDLSVLLTILARFGSKEEDAIESAFDAGLQKLGISIPFADGMKGNVMEEFDAALQNLARLEPSLKQKVLEAAVATAAADNVILPIEASIIQAIAAAIGLPIPQFDVEK